MLTYMGAKDNAAILQGQYWRLFTPMFLHGGVLHIALNSYFLYLIGPQVERSFGHWRFLAIYFLSGVAGVVASLAARPDVLSIGASGALFGLVGALIPLLYRNRSVLANTQRRIASVLQVIVINLVIGLTVQNIDNWGHIGGLLGGLTLAWFTTPRYAVRHDLDGAVRIIDETSPTTMWGAVAFVAAALIGLMYLLIVVRH